MHCTEFAEKCACGTSQVGSSIECYQAQLQIARIRFESQFLTLRDLLNRFLGHIILHSGRAVRYLCLLVGHHLRSVVDRWTAIGPRVVASVLQVLMFSASLDCCFYLLFVSPEAHIIFSCIQRWLAHKPAQKAGAALLLRRRALERRADCFCTLVYARTTTERVNASLHAHPLPGGHEARLDPADSVAVGGQSRL